MQLEMVEKVTTEVSVISQVVVNEVYCFTSLCHSDDQLLMQPKWEVVGSVVALYDYQSTDDNQLSFKTRDTMELINNE